MYQYSVFVNRCFKQIHLSDVNVCHTIAHLNSRIWLNVSLSTFSHNLSNLTFQYLYRRNAILDESLQRVFFNIGDNAGLTRAYSAEWKSSYLMHCSVASDRTADYLRSSTHSHTHIIHVTFTCTHALMHTQLQTHTCTHAHTHTHTSMHMHVDTTHMIMWTHTQDMHMHTHTNTE